MKNYTLILFLFVKLFKVVGQEPFEQHFSTSNGLPSNSVYSLKQDKKGYIWFSCNEGLYRYDGTHYKLYRNPNQTNFSGSGIIEDIKGRIWYQNFDGYSYYVENDILKEFNQSSASNLFPIQTTRSFLFIQENKCLIIIDVQTLKPIKRLYTKNFVYASTVYKNEFYYIDRNILYKIDDKLQKIKIAEAPVIETDFPFLTSCKSGIYLSKKSSLNNGIWHLNSNVFKRISNISSNVIIQNLRSHQDNIFILTSNGFYFYQVKTKRFSKEYFKTKSVSDLIIDFKGNYWLASNLNGISVIPNFKTFQYSFDFVQPVRSISFENKLLISSKNEKVVWFNPNNKQFEEFSSGNSNAIPYYLFIDKKRSELIFVQSDGYTYFTDLKSKKNLLKTILAIKKIIPIDDKYNAFVSSGLNGFYCHKNDLKKESFLDKTIGKFVKTTEGDYIFFRLPLEGRGKSLFYEKKSKNIYFTTNSGTYNLNKRKELISVFGKKSKMIADIFCWNNQLMSLGYDGNIHLLDDHSKTRNSKNSLLSEIKNGIQIKNFNDKLFIRTQNKIFVFYLDKNKLTKLYTSIDLINIECSDFSKIKDEIWIMTPNGFIQWNFDQHRKQKKTGRFIINTIKINNYNFNSIPSILKHNQNNLKIEYALLDYGISTISTIEYKINNQEWETIDPEVSSINFPQLATGKYILQFRGKVNSKYVLLNKIKFKIESPFWSTLWFIFILIILISGIITWYFKRKIKANRRLNKLTHDKIILESNLNKSLLASIKSQMNPHFIFNALNTIQAFIYMNDKNNAVNYLSKFSKLTRSILELSEKEVIPIAEDLKTLRLYLDLEKMRFQDGFEYIINTNSIDTNSVNIPPMLLQPYVENAIKHGLLHSENEKKLSIEMILENNILTITIDDNGIGRKKSGELNSQREKYHTSFASNANERRLNLINQNKEIAVLYTDKINEFGQATGTKVQLKITVNNEQY